jgi:hypothetical protein
MPPIIKPKFPVIPPVLKEYFGSNPRVKNINRPDGIWPIPPEFFKNPDMFKKLAADKDFMKNFEVVIMAKVR